MGEAPWVRAENFPPPEWGNAPIGHQDEAGNPFRIDSTAKALWAIRKLARLQTQRMDYCRTAEKEIAQIKQWLEDVQKTLIDDMAQLENLLAPWVKTQLEGSKRKSLKLLSATVGYRTPPKQLAYDEPGLFEWAKKNRRDWIRVKEELDKAAIRQSIIKDGEIVRDANDRVLAEALQPPDTFYVKWGKEE